jgi:hypothetical protein
MQLLMYSCYVHQHASVAARQAAKATPASILINEYARSLCVFAMKVQGFEQVSAAGLPRQRDAARDVDGVADGAVYQTVHTQMSVTTPRT